MIDPKAEPIAHRPPYKPIDVSGRKPVPAPEPAPVVLMVTVPGGPPFKFSDLCKPMPIEWTVGHIVWRRKGNP